jgi:hypothetical protein
LSEPSFLQPVHHSCSFTLRSNTADPDWTRWLCLHRHMSRADVGGSSARRASSLKNPEKSGCGIDRFVMVITSGPQIDLCVYRNLYFDIRPRRHSSIGRHACEGYRRWSAGAKYRLANGITLLGKFDGEFASHSSTYGGTGAFRY